MACGNMTVEQAEDMIREKVEDYSIQVQFRNDQTREIKGQDIRYAYVSDGSVQKLLDDQNPFTWIKGYFKGTDHETEENIQYDREALNAQLKSCLLYTSNGWHQWHLPWLDKKYDQYHIPQNL